MFLFELKVAATEREALRLEPEDLSQTQEEVNAACSDMPQHEEVIASLTQLSKDKACGWCKHAVSSRNQQTQGEAHR
jgi:hypothetical protein